MATKTKQSAGGIARAAALTKTQRKEIAAKAAEARWHGIPTAIKEGRLDLLGIDCAVLDDGRRVLSQAGVGRALGRQRSGKLAKSGRSEGADPIPFFVAGETIKPFLPDDLRVVISKPIIYRGSGGLIHGVDATLLPKICRVWISAARAGALKHEAQKAIGAKAEALLSSFAELGIVALVDEATGYQGIRPQDALQKYLEMIIRKELAAWSKRFPDEFYENIYKLKGWLWPGMQKNRFSVVAHYTRDLVYQRIAPTLLKELEKKEPKDENGHRKNKMHQWLTEDIGHPMLSQHMHALLMLQRLAIANRYGWTRFVRSVDQVLPKKGETLDFGFEVGG